MLWALACVPTPVTAEQTSPSPPPSEPPPSGEWSLSRASSELVTRLTERIAEAESLRADLLTLKGQLTDSEASLRALTDQLTASRSAQEYLQTALTETSRLLDSSRQELSDYRAAVAESERVQSEALRAARAERDLAWMVAGGAGLVAVVAAVVWGLTR
jgi:chromosome segregation ATPase